MWKRIETEIDLPRCPWCGAAASFLSYAGVTEINRCGKCHKMFGVMEVEADGSKADVFDHPADKKSETAVKKDAGK